MTVAPKDVVGGTDLKVLAHRGTTPPGPYGSTLLDRLPSHGFLIADVACPHLAPWSAR
jgi:hypothetical protein